jgi:hypothetical protein
VTVTVWICGGATDEPGSVTVTVTAGGGGFADGVTVTVFTEVEAGTSKVTVTVGVDSEQGQHSISLPASPAWRLAWTGTSAKMTDRIDMGRIIAAMSQERTWREKPADG